jgi:hypothetical protein
MEKQFNLRISKIILDNYKAACLKNDITMSKRLRKLIELDTFLLNKNQSSLDEKILENRGN